MDNVARTIGMDVEQFKQTNLYKKGDISYIVRREERERERERVMSMHSLFYDSLVHLMVKF